MDQNPEEQPILKEEPDNVTPDNVTPHDSPSHDILLPDPIDLISQAVARYTHYFSRIYPVLIIVYLTAALNIFAELASNTFAAFFLSVIGGLISLIAYIALIRILTDVESNPDDIVSNFKCSTKLFFPYVWIAIMEIAIVMGGTILLIIPGLIISIYLFLSVYVFVVEDKRGMKALVGSYMYVYGRWWQVLWRMFVYIIFLICISFIIMIFLTLTFGSATLSNGQPNIGIDLIQQLIQAFFFLPVGVAYSYSLYMGLRLSTNYPTAVDAEKTERTSRRILKVFGIIGAVIIPLLIIGAVILLVYAVSHHGSAGAAAASVGSFRQFMQVL